MSVSDEYESLDGLEYIEKTLYDVMFTEDERMHEVYDICYLVL